MPSFFWPQYCSSGVWPSRAPTAGALWGAPREDAREASWWGAGRFWSCPGPRVPVVVVVVGGTPEARIVRIVRCVQGLELLGNRPTLRSA